MNKIKIEILIGITILTIAFFLAGHYDVLEQLAKWSTQYEEYEIDEIITISFLVAIMLVVFSIRRLSELKIKTQELQNALDEIKTLKGIIPICAYCKEIRDEEGDWNHLEAYIQSHSTAEFSHGICPTCFKKQQEILNLTQTSRHQ